MYVQFYDKWFTKRTFLWLCLAHLKGTLALSTHVQINMHEMMKKLVLQFHGYFKSSSSQKLYPNWDSNLRYCGFQTTSFTTWLRRPELVSLRTWARVGLLCKLSWVKLTCMQLCPSVNTHSKPAGDGTEHGVGLNGENQLAVRWKNETSDAAVSRLFLIIS